MASQIDLLSKDGIIIPENAPKLKKCYSATKKTCFGGALAIDKCHLQIHAFLATNVSTYASSDRFFLQNILTNQNAVLVKLSSSSQSEGE